MKISRTSLQKYFEQPLPSITEIADAFTFHAFEIDSIEGDVLDVKVLPNRAADCNSETGLARELAAILNIPTTASRTSNTTPLAPVEVSLAQINNILGSDFSQSEVEGVFKRLGLETKVVGDTFTVTPPSDRPDLTIPEDIVEEVGRILGFDRVPATELPPMSGTPDQARYRGIERMKDQLVEKGFVEVSTQSFAKTGDIYLANPLDKSKPALRISLEKNLDEALVRAKQYAPLVLPPGEKPKLFEVGTVFPKAGEYMELRMTERVKEWGDAAGISDNLTVAKLEDYGKDYTPARYELGMYKPFSLYPFITRDIAFWVSSADGETPPDPDLEAPEMAELIRENANDSSLIRVNLLDRFKKDGRISYAFRLIFQSMEKTLTDMEVNETMKTISDVLSQIGHEVR